MTRNDWNVRIGEQGRGGTVVYREPGGELRFWWEFGGGDAVALINVGTAVDWATHHPWAAPRREEILDRVASEVIRQRAPSCKAEFDPSGWIALRPRDGAESAAGASSASSSAGASPGTPASPPAPTRQAQAAAQHFATSARRSRLVSILALVLVALATVAWLGRSALQIRTTGAPWGASMRTGNTVITLMTRLEPYVPSLNRNHGNDRYTVGLLLHDASTGRRRYVELLRGRAGNELSHTKLLAVQGSRVWVDTPETMLIDVDRGDVTSAAEVARDPSLRPPEHRFTLADLATGDRVLLQWLAAGGQMAGSRWLGIHAAREAVDDFSEGSRVPLAAPFERSAAPRRLYVAPLVRDGATTRLGAVSAVRDDTLFNGALVRVGRDTTLLELSGGGALMVYETRPRLAGTVVAARVAADGTVAWRTDTGLGALRDVLPHPEWPAFIGERPRIPDKVPEPILVVLDARTGRASTYSLWIRD